MDRVETLNRIGTYRALDREAQLWLQQASFEELLRRATGSAQTFRAIDIRSTCLRLLRITFEAGESS